MAGFEEDKKLITDYISNNLNDISTSYLVNDALKKFCQFLADKPVELITDISLINENPNLQKLLASFFNHNKTLIIDGSLEQYFNNPILIQLFDNYCTAYNINIDELSSKKSEINYSDDSLAMLIADISKYPVLDHDQTIAAFMDYKNNVPGAFEKLVNCNLRLVLSIAKRYNNHGMDLLDLFQEGSIGLMEAIKRYDYTRGTRFSTYATWWIRQAISREMANKVESIRLPVHLVEGTNKISKTSNILALELDREPTDEELAERTGYKLKEVKKFKELIYTRKNLLSLNATNPDIDKGELGDFIPSPDCIDDQVEELVLKDEVLKAFKKVNLSEKEIDIIKRRFGMDPYNRPQTLQEIATHYEMTREGVRVVQNTALRKLKNYLIFIKKMDEKKLNGIVENQNKGRVKRKSIYSYFKPEEYIYVSEAVSDLDAWDRKIINDHDNGLFITTSQSTTYYTIILPKIRKQVAFLAEKQWLREIDTETVLRMLKDERYYPLTARLSITDAIVVFLKYKFINNKEYTISQISEYLRIPEEEVTNKIKYISDKYQAIIDKLYTDYEKEYIISRRKKKK